MKLIDASGIIDRFYSMIKGGILMAERLIIAHTPQEAVQAKSGDNAYLAGGTEAMRLGSEFACDAYVSLRRTEALREVKRSSGKLEIGASCTFQELMDSADVPAFLKEALQFMASRTRRNMATIGGNVAVCRDDSFLVPTLLAASASVSLMNKDGSSEEVGLEQYIAGRDKYKDCLILSINLPDGAIVKSVRSANTAQSHARLTAALGKKDGLLFLDCDSNDWRIIKRNADMPEFEIGIFFSGLTRSLVNSDYNLRVYECKTAAWNMLAYTDQPLKTFDKTFLRDIPKATFDKTRIAMPARFARRAEHFYSEYRRVRQGVTAWETGNMKLFGKLSFDSCESSIHNYECGSPELIAIYEIMRQLPGVYGGRFSGAGFKGACIALVDPAYKEEIQKVLTEKYLEQFPEYEKTFQVFWVKPDDGARFLDN